MNASFVKDSLDIFPILKKKCSKLKLKKKKKTLDNLINNALGEGSK